MSKAAIRELCLDPIYDVEVLGLHVASTGNAYALAKKVLAILDENKKGDEYE